MRKGVVFSKITAVCYLFISFSVSYAAQQWKEAGGLLQKPGAEPIRATVVSQDNDKIIVRYAVPAPQFYPVDYQRINGRTPVRCVTGNAEELLKPGEPGVPVIPARIILPAGRTIGQVKVIMDNIVTIEDSYVLAYSEIPHPLSATRITWAQPSQSIYGSDKPYPAENYELNGIQYRCGVAIAQVDVYPVTYYPSTGTITYAKTFNVEIATTPDLSEGTGVRVDLKRFVSSGMNEENSGALDSYVDGSIRGPYEHALCQPGEIVDYIVITSKEIINATTQPNVNDLIALRQSQGLTGKVQDIAGVFASYSGESTPDKLRKYIKDAYNNMKVKFICLGGDTNIIPLKTVSCTNGSTTDNIPTDLPYFCLDGDAWSNDFAAEVYAGRISAQNVTEFSNGVFKTIEYTKIPFGDKTLTTGLGLGEKLDNTTYAKASILAIQAVFQGCTFDGLQDDDAVWTGAQVVTKVNTNAFTIINHFGHSNTTKVMKLTYPSSWKPENFTNTKPNFAYSQGCIPGAFDRDCIGEQMTTSNRTGMFAVVFNARFGWYQPNNPTGGSSHKLHLAFWQGYWTKNLEYVSKCNAYARETYKQYKWDALESNLLGDPATKFRLKGDVTPIESIPALQSAAKNPSFYISPNPARLHMPITMNFTAIGPVKGTLTIYTTAGKAIKTFFITPGRSAAQWDLKASGNQPVSSGIYLAVLKVTNVVGAVKLFKNFFIVQK